MDNYIYAYQEKVPQYPSLNQDSNFLSFISATLIQCGARSPVVQCIPCQYLGLPLSVKKLSKNNLLSLVDKVADRLPGWRAALVHPAGRVALVKVVLTAIPIHHLIVMQCPKWVLKAIEKIMRGFIWKGRKDVQGGHCLVGWNQVCRSPDLGGLGIHNHEILGWALNMRWLWLRKTQTDQPWAHLDIQVHPNVAAMFAVSVQSWGMEPELVSGLITGCVGN